MSNPPSMLQQRQRIHRRQNSTPVAFEALKVPTLSPAVQRHGSHRRGQSLDQRSPTRGAKRQTGSKLSITNQGSATIGQQILREAQQQTLARPGQRNQSPVSPQRSTILDHTIDQGGLHNANTIDAILQEQAKMQVATPIEQYFAQDLYMPISAGLESMDPNMGDESQHYFQTTHSTRHGLEDEMTNERTMSQPDLQMYAQQRPNTPAQLTNRGEFKDQRTRTRLTWHSSSSSYTRTSSVQAKQWQISISKNSSFFANSTGRQVNQSTTPNLNAAWKVL